MTRFRAVVLGVFVAGAGTASVQKVPPSEIERGAPPAPGAHGQGRERGGHLFIPSERLVAVPFGDDDRDGLWHYLNAGLFNTGRRDLVLGVETSLRQFPRRGRVDSEAIVASVVVRDYW